MMTSAEQSRSLGSSSPSFICRFAVEEEDVRVKCTGTGSYQTRPIAAGFSVLSKKVAMLFR